MSSTQVCVCVWISCFMWFWNSFVVFTLHISACSMASTVKLESESDTEFDPLSTQSDSELLDIKQEEFLVPVAVTDSEVSLAWCRTFSCVSQLWWFHDNNRGFDTATFKMHMQVVCYNSFYAWFQTTSSVSTDINSLMQEWNSWCNLQNSIFKLQELQFDFLCANFYLKISKTHWKNPNRAIKNGHNWLMHRIWCGNSTQEKDILNLFVFMWVVAGF
jgi:hypothetical protein